MGDVSVATTLRSSTRLVVVEAPGGCGKTFQGASYARDVAPSLGDGRLLILTHTNAACDVFAARTRGLSRCVEIRTIDGLISEIAGAYHKALGLPAEVGAWARREVNGYGIIAQKTAALLAASPMIAECLARRFPVIVCDEHQDASADQHRIVMALHAAGAYLRVFADPMQQIFNGSQAGAAAAEQRWTDLRNVADRFEELDHPHRWANSQPALGAWILAARATLRDGGQIDLTANLPAGLSVHYADNTAPRHGGFTVAQNLSGPIYAKANGQASLLVLTGQNATVTSLRAFFNRRLPIWEGHVRDGLARLVAHANANQGNPAELARGAVDFMGAVASGFSSSAFGDRFVTEAQNGCAANCTGKPRLLQSMAWHIVNSPNHQGIARALDRLQGLIANEAAFADVRVHHSREFAEAIQLGKFDNADEGFAEIARRRTYARPKLPAKAISTIHKAKGLEFDNVMLLPCDRRNFSNTRAARAKLYVALSRATSSLMLVVSRGQPTPLFKI
ncbi:ATP-binding domain-containing protein [Bradyrhizobium liaoningense]|uniref:3'-5' exonuclease n=1 Tax=Bradyrhizobium liaoningense TaxID=43992 RepID=UPI001BAA580E|nr:3'-5' exonuclease [Bradyrhizobium liaoningense]MBR0838686.1 ATP-binding domain-containing protein [Bradyrhizobium liaoningense]